jgi:hypothetical protein
MGAPLNNNNAGKNKRWLNSLDRAILQDDGKRLRDAAEKLLNLAAQGEQWAINHLADRLDGKAAQSVTISGDAENPLAIKLIERVIIDNAKD